MRTWVSESWHSWPRRSTGFIVDYVAQNSLSASPKAHILCLQGAKLVPPSGLCSLCPLSCNALSRVFRWWGLSYVSFPWSHFASFLTALSKLAPCLSPSLCFRVLYVSYPSLQFSWMCLLSVVCLSSLDCKPQEDRTRSMSPHSSLHIVRTQ